MGDEEERRRTPRYYLVSRVDVVVVGSGDPLWGAIANISRTGTTLYIRQTLKPRIKVGESALVGMGSVVIRDVPAGKVVAGNPAREIPGSRYAAEKA